MDRVGFRNGPVLVVGQVHGRGAAVDAHVHDQLVPDKTGNILGNVRFESGRLQGFADLLNLGRHLAVDIADNGLALALVHVQDLAGLQHTGTLLGSAAGHIVVTDNAADHFRVAQTVLHGQRHGLFTKQILVGLDRRAGSRALHKDHDQIAHADLGGIRHGLNIFVVGILAIALHAEAIAVDLVHVSLEHIDEPHLVAGDCGQMRTVQGTHTAGT